MPPTPSNTNSEAVADPRTAVQIALIGCNHRTAPVEFRERIAFTSEQARDAAHSLRQRGILQEAVVLSTCNRSELYGVPADSGAAATETMEEFLTSFHGIPRVDFDGRFYHRTGRDAIQHLYRVAAGLDSMLLGEAEILGQLRAAYNQALEYGSTGPILNRAFQGALEVGKRIRAETEVGARPMSVAFAGVKLAERVFGNLKGRSALIVGAGAVAEQVVEHLRNRGIGRLQVVNRSSERAEELAQRMGGKAVPWQSLESALGVPDVIVTSVGGGEPVLTRPMLEMALAARAGKPIFVVDLGVPRNVVPDAAGLYNLYLYNVDDLGEIVEQNRRAREAEIPRAEAIIVEHVAKFESWRAALAAGSIVDELREHFHRHREELLREHLAAAPGASAEERERLSKITEDLVERLLVEPTARLRQTQSVRSHLGALDTLRHLFGISGKGSAGKPGENDE